MVSMGMGTLTFGPTEPPKNTKTDGGFKTGDKIEAQVTAKGHAVSMKQGNPAK